MGKSKNKSKGTSESKAPEINGLNSDTPPSSHTPLEQAALNYYNGVKGGRQLLREAADVYAKEQAGS